MCLTCGCDRPNEDWGDPDNITVNDIHRAVETNAARGMTADEAMEEMYKTWNEKVSKQDKEYTASIKSIFSPKKKK